MVSQDEVRPEQFSVVSLLQAKREDMDGDALRLVLSHHRLSGVNINIIYIYILIYIMFLFYFFMFVRC